MNDIMEFERGRAWIELDGKALAHNVNALKARLPSGCEMMAVVKADAYGHGAQWMAVQLDKLGINAFCVATVTEGVALRKQGVNGQILILGYTHTQQLYLLDEYKLTQTVVDCADAARLNKSGVRLHVHLGIDTGMHRLGARWEGAAQIAQVFQMENLCITGIFTHLCAADSETEADKQFTQGQIDAFWSLIAQLKARGIHCPSTHILNSSGLLNHPQAGGDFARVGIALCGVLSTSEEAQQSQINLQPVLSLKARITSVRRLYQGESAGYGLSHTANKDETIAAISIGYADGLPRALSCKVGSVLIDGHAAPIISRVCMDQLIVDVTDIPRVQAGGIATIIGTDGGKTISAYDIAQQSHSITNEVLSRLGARLPRVIV